MQPLHSHDPPRVGPYRLHARLGEDACARTYLASAPARPVAALNVVRSEHTSDPRFRAAFTRSVNAVQELRSPYVAPVLDADTERATPWVAVARPTGPTLATAVHDHGPVAVAALHPLALALAQGLADLHAAGQVHGSLSPDGALLSPHAALITDPGFEQALAETGHATPLPEFAPPEGGLSPAADVFAWATTLCFAASGVAGPTGLDRVPFQYRALMDACLTTDPRLRPTAIDLVHMLGGPSAPGDWPPAVRAIIGRYEEETRRALASTSQPSRPPGDTDEPKPRRTRRGRVLALTAAIAALVFVAAGAVHALWPSEEDLAQADTSEEVGDAACMDGTGFPEPSGDIDSLNAMNVAFSPDGDLLAVTSHDHGLTLWDWREGVEIARPLEEVHMDGAPVFAPFGCTIAVTVPYDIEGSEDPAGKVATLNVSSGRTDEHPDPPLTGTTVYHDRVTAFSPDGDRLVIALGGGFDRFAAQDTFALIDLATGKIERTWGSQRVLDMAYTEDGRVAAVGPEGFTLWDPDTGENLRTESPWDLHHLALVEGTTEVILLDSNTGRTVHWDYEERVEIDVPDLSELAEDPYTALSHITVDPDRRRLHVGWVTDTEGMDERYLAWFSGIEFTNHGALVDLDSGENLLAEQGEHELARPLALHPEGEVIAAITQDGEVNLVDADSLAVLHPLR